MGHDLPEMHGPGVDRSPTTGPVSAIENLARGDAASFQLVLAVAPAAGAEPADIGHWIAPGAELPIQDGGQPVCIDHVVTAAVILMDQDDLAWTGCVALGPAQAPFEHRVCRGTP